MNTVSQINPNLNTKALPDDCDRASSIIGMDINKYVFGDIESKDTSYDTFNNSNKKTFKNSNAAGFLGFLGMIGCACSILFNKFKH